MVTFTRKAAGELRGRLARLGAATGVRAGTFHAIAFAQLRRHWADRDIRPGVILSNPLAVVGAVAGTSADPALSAAVLAEIHWAQVRLVPPSGYATAAAQAGRAVSGATPDDVATVFARYQQEKARRGSLDLDDLVTTCANVLETDEVAGAALRWRTRHVYVDEFQDVNPAQWRLLRAWVGDRPDLFVVGDPRQAVFGWNGADPTLLDRLPSLLPDLTVIRLDDNHRSTPQVVAAARAVLGFDRAHADAARRPPPPHFGPCRRHVRGPGGDPVAAGHPSAREPVVAPRRPGAYQRPPGPCRRGARAVRDPAPQGVGPRRAAPCPRGLAPPPAPTAGAQRPG